MEGLLIEIDRHAAPGAALAEPVVRAFHDSEHADDVCVLALRLAG